MELPRLGLLIGSGLLVCAAGCSEGTTEAASPGAVTPVGRVEDLAVAEAPAGLLSVTYYVADLQESVRLEVEVSEDRGRSFRSAAYVTGTLALSPGESGGTFLWNAAEDLSEIPQGDVVLRLTPYGTVSKLPGTPALSQVFAYGENHSPVILAFSAPGPEGGSPLALSIQAADPEGDVTKVLLRYSTGGTATFTDATLRAGGDISDPADPTLKLSEAGSSATLLWEARADLGLGHFTDVYLKLTLSDAQQSQAELIGPLTVTTYRPSITAVTVEDIPSGMNGSQPFTNLDGEQETFSLLVPASGFTLRVIYEPHALGAAIDPDSLTVTASCPVGELQPGTDLGPLFTATPTEAVLTLSDSLALAAGEASFTARVADTLGNESEPVSLSFLVESPGQGARPFSPPDTWVLRFDRDWWTVSADCSSSRISISTTFEKNGRADFLDDLQLVGLYNEEAPEVSQWVLWLVKDRILANLREFYFIEEDGGHTGDSPNIFFTLSSAEASSAVAIGGADPAGGYTLGRAYFDWGNTGREDDTAPSLGVFSTNLIRFYINTSWSFQEIFDPLCPCRGDPVGSAGVDQRVLSGDFDPSSPENTGEEQQRYETVYAAADAFGRAVAAILAHEIGHSVGLVANGPPPSGLFGGESNAAFSGYWTDPYHIDTSGNNIMEAAMSFTVMQYRGPSALRFNKLNSAYLRQRILLRWP